MPETGLMLGTNNCMSLPMNPDIDKTLKALAAASVVGLQEIDPLVFKHAAAHQPDFALVPIPDDDLHSCGIMYRPAVWELKGHGYHKEYDGVSLISKTRHFAVARLRHKTLDKVFAFVSYHAVTAGNDPDRRRMRRAGLKALRAFIKQCKRDGIPVIVFGDFNSKRIQLWLAQVKFRHLIDHIYAFNSKDVKLSGIISHHYNTPSDHDAFLAQFDVKTT